MTIRDGAEKPGGMMRYGIPAYRLPRDVLDAEIDRILALGVELRCGEPVDRPGSASCARAATTRCSWRSARTSRATPRSPAAPPPTCSTRSRCCTASPRTASQPQLGRRVVVYGGGDTALDAARSARRLTGVRAGDRLPAHPRAHAGPRARSSPQAEQEGIAFRWLSTIAAAEPGRTAARLRIERMELDEDGIPQPTGEFEELDADTVILALGQSADLALLEGLRGDPPSSDGVGRRWTSR